MHPVALILQWMAILAVNAPCHAELSRAELNCSRICRSSIAGSIPCRGSFFLCQQALRLTRQKRLE
jgi:hypothetical protein